jgi:hypothetical protein
MSAQGKDFIKAVLRNARDGGLRSAWGCLTAGRIRRHLPALSRAFPAEDFEIQILTGCTRLTMALWMAASWVAATSRNWRFVFHDDGTLTESDAGNIRALLPGSRVLLSAQTSPEVVRALSRHPLCLQCRNRHPLGRKLIDMPIFASQPQLLTIDTDILFYRRPERLLRWIAQDDLACLFMEDVQDACLLTAAEAARMFGVKLAQRVNTGIVAVPKSVLPLDFLEDCLARTNLLQRDPWFIEQTLYALAASASGQVELLNEEYFMPLDPACPNSAVARHYMGANRHLFYSEGLPRASRMLRDAARGAA